MGMPLNTNGSSSDSCRRVTGSMTSMRTMPCVQLLEDRYRSPPSLAGDAHTTSVGSHRCAVLLLAVKPPSSPAYRPTPAAFLQYGQLGLPGTFGKSKFRSEEHTSELQSHSDLVCRLLLEKK